MIDGIIPFPSIKQKWYFIDSGNHLLSIILAILDSLKKIAAILLLTILVFNWFGYRLIAVYFENRASAELQQQLDNNSFEADQLMSIKIPIDLPYGPNTINFEKTAGNIDINGVNYQFVKRRFYRDTLELVCIANTSKTRVYKIRDEIGKDAVDYISLTNPKKAGNNHAQIVKYVQFEYYWDHSNFDFNRGPVKKDIVADACNVAYSSAYSLAPERPPKA